MPCSSRVRRYSGTDCGAPGKWVTFGEGKPHNQIMTGGTSKSLAEAEKVLTGVPFGVCLLAPDERILWINDTLRDQLELGTGDVEGLPFDDLPVDPQRDTGTYRPHKRPGLRLRVTLTSLNKDLKLATFTDVTDLTNQPASYVELLREMATTDAVTGLRSRSRINQDLLSEIARSRRYGNQLAVIRLAVGGAPLDDLEEAQRSEVLRLTGVKLADNTRAIDYAGKWSDGEFLVVLPETSGADGERLAQKLRSLLESEAYAINQGGEIPIQVRYGVADWSASDDAATMLERAAPS